MRPSAFSRCQRSTCHRCRAAPVTPINAHRAFDRQRHGGRHSVRVGELHVNLGLAACRGVHLPPISLFVRADVGFRISQRPVGGHIPALRGQTCVRGIGWQRGDVGELRRGVTLYNRPVVVVEVYVLADFYRTAARSVCLNIITRVCRFNSRNIMKCLPVNN